MMDAMSARDEIHRELDKLPEPALEEVLAFLRAKRIGEAALLAEPLLAREWLRPEEDEAWADL